jgi:hypothetical protein
MPRKVVIIIVWIIIVGTIILVIYANSLMRSYVGEVKDKKAPAPQAFPSLFQKGTEEPAVQPDSAGRQPDDPAKFGIVIVKQVDQPTGPDQWDALMQKIFEASGTLKTKEGQAAVRKMQMSPLQYKATLKRLDGEISKIEVAVYRNALDPSLQKRLTALYQMKALGHVLEKNGIVNSSAPALPTYDRKAGAFHGDGPH